MSYVTVWQEGEEWTVLDWFNVLTVWLYDIQQRSWQFMIDLTYCERVTQNRYIGSGDQAPTRFHADGVVCMESLYHWIVACTHLGSGTGHRTATMAEPLLPTSDPVWYEAVLYICVTSPVEGEAGVLICDSSHSWWLYGASSPGHQTAGTMDMLLPHSVSLS